MNQWINDGDTFKMSFLSFLFLRIESKVCLRNIFYLFSTIFTRFHKIIFKLIM